MNKMLKISLTVTLSLASSANASEYSFEFFSGTVYNMKEDLTIRQSGEDDIVVNNADLKTHPQTTPF